MRCFVGYYRVNYDDELWSQIQTALHSEGFGDIDTINRAQIVDDIFNLARAGLVSYSRALNIISYLEQETEYYPWYSAFTALSYLNRRIGKDETLAPLFQVSIATLAVNNIIGNLCIFTRNSYPVALKRRLKRYLLMRTKTMIKFTH